MSDGVCAILSINRNFYSGYPMQAAIIINGNLTLNGKWAAKILSDTSTSLFSNEAAQMRKIRISATTEAQGPIRIDGFVKANSSTLLSNKFSATLFVLGSANNYRPDQITTYTTDTIEPVSSTLPYSCGEITIIS